MFGCSQITRMEAEHIVSEGWTDGITIRYGNTKEDRSADCGVLDLERPVPISGETVYDLASLTKILTLIAVMRLCEEGELSLEACIGDYNAGFPSIAHLKVYELLNFARRLRTEKPIEVGDRYQDAMLKLQNIELEEGAPAYSDIGILVISKMIDEILAGRSSFQRYTEALWHGLGLTHTCWWFCLPEDRLRFTQCYDNEYKIENGRLRRIRTPLGRVHDGKAAVLRACGHAGVLSTSEDIALLAQKLLSGSVLTPASIDQIVSDRYISHGANDYGLACYRKNPDRHKSEIPEKCSDESIAISGYTGTHLLLDFKKQFYVFIGANRIHNRLTRSDGSELSDPDSRAAASALVQTNQYVYRKDALVEKCMLEFGI